MPVLVAVGCSSSLGSLALQRFLLATTERWTVYAAHRSPDPPSWEPTHDHHHVEWIPLELESLASVKRFAQQVTPTRVDLVWLNAAVWDNSAPRVVHLGEAEWTRAAVVNCIGPLNRLARGQFEGVLLLTHARVCMQPSTISSTSSPKNSPLLFRTKTVGWLNARGSS